ncbi:MAG: hypothetical protein VX603_09525 [Gemmatimonadota bacterium]|nr:hypothetical protein [Gemmatimonadota bacterium]
MQFHKAVIFTLKRRQFFVGSEFNRGAILQDKKPIRIPLGR